MPSYLTDPKQAFVPTNLYTPNFDAIGGMLRMRQSQYDQGFNQVQSTRSSILNAPLTKQANVEDRELYLKQADDELKNLSSADLSLSQNVVQAQKVFQPFFQDKEILQDMMWTKQNMGEIQKGLALRDSKDEKERSQFFGQSIANLQDQASKVRNAAKGDTSVYENKRYVPYKDPNEHLNKMAKEQGLAIEWTEGANTPQLYEFKNGKKTQKDFKNWASQQLATPEFQDVFNVMGEYDMNQQIKGYSRTLNPETGMLYSEEEAKNRIAKDYIKGMHDYYTNNNQEITDKVGKLKKNSELILSKYPSGIPANSSNPAVQDDINMLKAYAAENAELDSQVKNNTAELEKWKPGGSNYQPTVEDISSFGGRFFAKQYGERMAYNWASTYASTHQKDGVKTNEAYNEKVKNDLAYQRLRLDEKKLQLEAEAGFFNRGGKGGTGNAGTKRADGTTIQVGDVDYDGNGLNDIAEGYGDQKGKINSAEAKLLRDKNPNSGMDNGYATTDIYKVENPHELYKASLKADFNNAIDTRYDALAKMLPSLDITFKDGTKLDMSTAVAFANQSKENLKDFTSHGKDSVVQKMFDYLKEQGVPVKAGSPTSIYTGLKSLIKSRIDNFTEAKKELPVEFSQGLVQMNNADDLYNKWNKSYSDYNSKIDDLLSTNKKYNALTIVQDGKRRLLTADDIKSEFAPVTLVDKEGKEVKLSSAEAADLYLKNKLQFRTAIGGGIVFDKVGDKENLTLKNDYKIDRQRGMFEDFTPQERDNAYKYLNYSNDVTNKYDKIKKKYGDVSSLTDLRKQVEKDAAGIIYNQTTGKIGHAITYDVDSKNNNFGAMLVNNISNPDNRQGTNLSADNSIDGFVDAIANDPSKVTKVDYLTVSDKGVPAVKLKFDPKLFDTKAGAADYLAMGLTEDDAKKIIKQGLSLTVYLSPTAKGEAVDHLIHPKDNFIYGAVLKGEKLKSTELQESTNFRYSLTPNNYGASTKSQASDARLKVEVRNIDPNTGQWGAWVPFNGLGVDGETNIPLAGDNGKSIDDVKAQIDRLYQYHLFNNNDIIKARNKVIADTKPAPGQKTMTYEDFLNEAKNR